MGAENIESRINRIKDEFEAGWNFLLKFNKTVTFFGSARLSRDSEWYKSAVRLAGMLADSGFTIVTGGGPGIMEAGNKGADEHNTKSVGLNIQLAHEQRTNDYVRDSMGFHYFFTRKVMLSYAAQAYVYFPGGFGTLDEFFEIVTLIQTRKISSTIPLILIGEEYWAPLLDWIGDVVLKRFNAVGSEDVKIYTLVDTPEEALELIKCCPERSIGYRVKN